MHTSVCYMWIWDQGRKVKTILETDTSPMNVNFINWMQKNLYSKQKAQSVNEEWESCNQWCNYVILFCIIFSIWGCSKLEPNILRHDSVKTWGLIPVPHYGGIQWTLSFLCECDLSLSVILLKVCNLFLVVNFGKKHCNKAGQKNKQLYKHT